MVTSIYLASTEARSGKSAIALGVIDQLLRRAGRVGVFRPVSPGSLADGGSRSVADGSADRLLTLLLSRLQAAGPGTETPSAADCIGVTYDDMHEDLAASMSRIVDRFHAASQGVDTMLVVGSDFTDVTTPTEFVVNARIASHLGAPMLLVVPGARASAQEIATAAELAVTECHTQHASVLGVVANRVDEAARELVAASLHARLPGIPTSVVPDSPLLQAPTVRDLMRAVDGTLIHGDEQLLERESMGIVVAAMTMPHVLDRLIESGVVVSPGDREEVVLGTLLAHRASTFPTLSALFLNGGFPLPPQVDRLLEGLGVELPIIACAGGTMTTASRLHATRGLITPETTRKVETALELVGEHVDVESLLGGITAGAGEVVTPLMFEHQLVERAREAHARIILPEGEEERILRSAGIVLSRGIASLVILGAEKIVRDKAARLGVDLLDTPVIDPDAPEHEALRRELAEEYARLRAHKGVTIEQAFDLLADRSYFGTLMVATGRADGMVSGSVTTTAATIRPALEVIRTKPGTSIVSSVFLMCLADRVLVYGDCAVNPDPSATQLADIAISSAATAAQFGIDPRVALLSYSTGASGTGADVDKVRAATELVRERTAQAGLPVEGPIQYDAAVDPTVAATKLAGSPVAGRATVLVFPDLNTGNNTYKAVQRSASAVAIGPVMQGLNKPVNDLSRGALVEDIVNTVAITAIQAGGQ